MRDIILRMIKILFLVISIPFMIAFLILSWFYVSSYVVSSYVLYGIKLSPSKEFECIKDSLFNFIDRITN